MPPEKTMVYSVKIPNLANETISQLYVIDSEGNAKTSGLYARCYVRHLKIMFKFDT